MLTQKTVEDNFDKTTCNRILTLFSKFDLLKIIHYLHTIINILFNNC